MFSHHWQRLGCSKQLPTHHSGVASRALRALWDQMANSLESGATRAFSFRLVPSHNIVRPIKAESSPHMRVLLLLFSPYLYPHSMPKLFSCFPDLRKGSLLWLHGVPCLGFEPSLLQEAPNFISLLAEVSAFCPTLSSNLPTPKLIYLPMFYDYVSCLEAGFCIRYSFSKVISRLFSVWYSSINLCMYLLISKHLWVILVIVLGAGLQRQKTSSYSLEPYQPSERNVHRQRESCVLSAAGDSAGCYDGMGWWGKDQGKAGEEQFPGLVTLSHLLKGK